MGCPDGFAAGGAQPWNGGAKELRTIAEAYGV